MKERLRTKADSEGKKDVQDWGSLTWFASSELTDTDVTLGRAIIKPGKANPRHCHDTCEEVLYLLRGRLEHTLGQDTVIMEPGDTLVVPPGVMHNGVSIGDGDADMIVAYSSGQRDFRKERPS